METTPSNTKTHSGSCHCGAVRFEVEVDASKGSRCNCSVCTKLGMTTSIIKPAAFRLLSDPGALTGRGETVEGRRFFCKQCGVHSHSQGHLEILGGDYLSVNLNALDDIDPSDISVVYWDGRHDNWEAGPRDTPWPIFTSA